MALPATVTTSSQPSPTGSASGLAAGVTANRPGDRREPIGEVRAAATPDLRTLTQLADKDSEAVMLDFLQPAGSGGRVIGERRFARADETDRRESSPAGRGGAPDVPQANAAAVMAMRVIWLAESREQPGKSTRPTPARPRLARVPRYHRRAPSCDPMCLIQRLLANRNSSPVPDEDLKSASKDVA